MFLLKKLTRLQSMQSIDLIETYAYKASKYLVCKKEETKYNNIIRQYKSV